MSGQIDEWVFECVLQYLKSPMWTSPVLGFIEEHCHEFDTDDEENKLVYTQLHMKFREMVDSLLSGFLKELGVSCEDFVEAVKRQKISLDSEVPPQNEESAVILELSEIIAEYLFALDDFTSFRALMERKNAEMELEAIYEYARYTSQVAVGEEMSEEERFLFEMAVRLSLGEKDVALKRLEAQDMELLQTLALSVAQEHERQVLRQVHVDKGTPAPPEISSPSRRTPEEINEEIRQIRVENVERVVKEITADPAAANARPSYPPSSPPNSPLRTPNPVPSSKLAPLKSRRQLVFGAGPALPLKPECLNKTATKPSAPIQQPSLAELRKEVEEKLGTSAEGTAPAPDEIAQRAEYFKRQRERLVQLKKEERENEMRLFLEEKSLKNSNNNTNDNKENIPTRQQSKKGQPASSAKPTTTTVNNEITAALARRFRDDIIKESAK